jgi:uncharacterized membrane protein
MILVAICMVLLLWGGAFGVDLGLTVDGGRQVQAIADTSALDLARYVGVSDWAPYSTQALANQYLNLKLPYADTDNGSGATLSQITGVWQNGTFTPAGGTIAGKTVKCFHAVPASGAPLCNAVKITAAQSVPQIFVGGHSSVTKTSIAAITPEAGFSIGSYLTPTSITSQQVTVLNAVLGTLGTSVNITSAGYTGLANTDATVNQLITASGGLLTASNVMTASLTAAQWLAIWNDAVANQVAQLNCGATPTPEQCGASTALSSLDFSSSTSAQLCQLVSINGSACSPTALSTLTTADLSASLDALQTLTTEAELANGTTAIDLGTSLGITGVTDAQLTLSLLQAPRVGYGPTGTTATTAQVAANLELNDPGVGLINIPLCESGGSCAGSGVTGASGTATLTNLVCADNSFSTASIQPATSAAAGTVTLTVAGVASTIATLAVTSSAENLLTFTAPNVPPIPSSVTGDSNPQVVSGSPIPSFTGLSGPATPVVAQAGAILVPILQAAGVSLGDASVADLSTDCGAVALVQ